MAGAGGGCLYVRVGRVGPGLGGAGVGRMRLRAVVRAAPSARRPWRVLSPRRRPNGLWICPLDSHFVGQIVGTREALLHLGAWFRMAGISPHSVVHVPAGGPRPCGVPWYGPSETSVDLVVMRRDVGMRASAWSGIRRSLAGGRPVTLRPPQARPVLTYEPLPPGTDGLVLAEHGRTLLVSGPAPALLRAGDVISAVGEAIASDRHVHRRGYAHLGALTPLLREPGTTRRGLELLVMGADPRFHKKTRQAGADGE